MKTIMKKIFAVFLALAMIVGGMPHSYRFVEASESSKTQVGNLLILGDSYSTFDGYIPEGNVTWYQSGGRESNNVTTVDETWWKIFESNTDAKLLLNESYSGSTICNTGLDGADVSSTSFIGRFDKLVENGWFKNNTADTIVIFGGTNDFWLNSPVGEPVYSEWNEEDKKELLPAFCYLLNGIKENAPNARVLCVMNDLISTTIIDSMNSICNIFNVDCVRLSGIDKLSGHPSVEGMKQVEEQIRQSLTGDVTTPKEVYVEKGVNTGKRDSWTRYEMYLKFTDETGVEIDMSSFPADVLRNTVYIDGKPVTGTNLIIYEYVSANSQILLHIQYSCFEQNVTKAANMGKHTVVIPKGTIFGSGEHTYITQNDIGYYIEGESVNHATVIDIGEKTGFYQGSSTSPRYQFKFNWPSAITGFSGDSTIYSAKVQQNDGTENVVDVTCNIDTNSTSANFRVYVWYQAFVNGKNEKDTTIATSQVTNGKITIPGGAYIAAGYIIKNAAVCTIAGKTHGIGTQETDIKVTPQYSDANVVSSSATGFYFATNVADGLAYDINGNAEYTLTDDDNGYTIKKVGENLYFLDIGMEAEEGQQVDLEGYIDMLDYRVSIAPITYQYTQGQWVEYNPYPYHELAIQGIQNNISKVSSDGTRWDVYVNVDGTVPGTAWKITFQDVAVYLGETGITSYVTVQKYEDTRLFFGIPTSILPATVEEGTRLTFKAGNYYGYTSDGERTDGITITADYAVEWNGTKWEAADMTVYTECTIDGFTKDTGYHISAAIWQGYFQTTAESLPGTAWEDVFSILISVNDGDNVTATGKKSNTDHVLYLEIPSSQLPLTDASAKVTIKAGNYKSSLGEVGCAILEDYTFYVNRYAWSESQLPSATATSPEFRWNENNASNSQNGFVISMSEDDGTKYNPENAWDESARLYPLPAEKKFVDDTLYFASSGNGLYIDGTYVANVHIQKMNEYTYYVSLAESGYAPSESVADERDYQLKGYFYDGNHKIVYYETGVLTWNGDTWELSTVNLEDSGIDGDVNGDAVLNIADLIRLMRHQKNGMVAINEAREDINYDGERDAYDVIALRRVLVEAMWYRGDEELASVPYGLPIVDADGVIDRMAYACPEITTWSGTRYASDSTFELYDTKEIDVLFQEYKATGLNLMITEYVAPLTTYAHEHPFNDPLRAYLEGAERNGLGVIVASDYVNGMLKADSSAFEEGGVYASWQEVLAGYIRYLEDYPAFRGFMMSDELSSQYASNYQMVATWLKENYPDLIPLSAQLPNYGTDEGGTLFTETTYQSYIDDFGPYSGYFMYDHYSLWLAENSYGQQYNIRDYWYTNLKWVAEHSVDADGNQRYIPGITIQAMSQSAGSSENNGITTTYTKYAPERKADIGFQVYTSLAWGMQSIHYFSYADHMVSSIQDEILVNENVKNAVTSVNAELTKFQSVYKGFTWKQTLDLENAENSATGNERLKSVKVSNARSLIGCMKDKDGFDGYMIANAEGPRKTASAEVTLTFAHATSAIVYVGGEKQIVEFTDGQYTFTVPVGEGIFVIPIR